MQTSDLFRSRIDAMINLNDPLAVLATRLPWDQIEAALSPILEHKDRSGRTCADVDLFGPNLVTVGVGRSNAGRPRLPIRLMTSLLYCRAMSSRGWPSLADRGRVETPASDAAVSFTRRYRRS